MADSGQSAAGTPCLGCQERDALHIANSRRAVHPANDSPMQALLRWKRRGINRGARCGRPEQLVVPLLTVRPAKLRAETLDGRIGLIPKPCVGGSSPLGGTVFSQVSGLPPD